MNEVIYLHLKYCGAGLLQWITIISSISYRLNLLITLIREIKSFHNLFRKPYMNCVRCISTDAHNSPNMASSDREVTYQGLTPELAKVIVNVDRDCQNEPSVYGSSKKSGKRHLEMAKNILARWSRDHEVDARTSMKYHSLPKEDRKLVLNFMAANGFRLHDTRVSPGIELVPHTDVQLDPTRPQMERSNSPSTDVSSQMNWESRTTFSESTTDLEPTRQADDTDKLLQNASDDALLRPSIQRDMDFVDVLRQMAITTGRVVRRYHWITDIGQYRMDRILIRLLLSDLDRSKGIKWYTW